MRLLDPQKMTKEEVQELWDKVDTKQADFDDRVKGRADIFIMSLFNGTKWIDLNGKGLASFAGVTPGGDAVAHFIVWDDSNPHEIVSMLREVLQAMFREHKLVRVTTMVSEAKPNHIRLAKLLGFYEEGRMRDASLYDGKFYKTTIFGLLREEFYVPKEG